MRCEDVRWKRMGRDIVGDDDGVDYCWSVGGISCVSCQIADGVLMLSVVYRNYDTNTNSLQATFEGAIISAT